MLENYLLYEALETCLSIFFSIFIQFLKYTTMCLWLFKPCSFFFVLIFSFDYELFNNYKGQYLLSI